MARVKKGCHLMLAYHHLMRDLAKALSNLGSGESLSSHLDKTIKLMDMCVRWSLRK